MKMHKQTLRPNTVLRVDNQSREVRIQTHSGVFVCGLQTPLRFSPCKTHPREMAQTSGFDSTLKVKTCFGCNMFDVSNWVACLNGEDDPRGTPSHETLSVASQGALEILGSLFTWSETISAHLEWWRNCVNVMKGPGIYSKEHNIQIFTDASNEGLGAHLEQVSTKDL